MADTKISQLPSYPSGTAPIATDILPIVDTSVTPYVTRQIPWANVLSAQTTPVPYLAFLGSAQGGANQSFSSAELTLYSSAGQATVVVDGVVMTPNENYTLIGAQITIQDYLPPYAEVEVIFKIVPNLGIVNDITVQNGIDILLDQSGNSLITQ